MLDLTAGRIDGYISDIPALLYYTKDKPNLAVVERITTGEQYSMMFAKDAELASQVNDVLSELKKEASWLTCTRNGSALAPKKPPRRLPSSTCPSCKQSTRGPPSGGPAPSLIPAILPDFSWTSSKRSSTFRSSSERFRSS